MRPVVEHGRQCGWDLKRCPDLSGHAKWLMSTRGTEDKPELGTHYRPAGLPETWEIIEGWQESWPVAIRYHLGNVTKYLARIGRKKEATVESDLDKLIDYANRAKKVLGKTTSWEPPF